MSIVNTILTVAATQIAAPPLVVDLRDCQRLRPAELSAILNMPITRHDLRAAGRVEAGRLRRLQTSLPGVPFCFDLAAMEHELGRDAATRRSLAAEGPTWRAYATILLNGYALRNPELAGLPPRAQWTRTMRRNATLVADAPAH